MRTSFCFGTLLSNLRQPVHLALRRRTRAAILPVLMLALSLSALVPQAAAQTCPVNLTAQTTVTRGGFRQNLTTKRFLQTVTIKNNGPQARPEL